MYIDRQIFPDLMEMNRPGKVTVLIGGRQTGKTTLLRELHRQLKTNWKCLFLDLDIYSNYE